MRAVDQKLMISLVWPKRRNNYTLGMQPKMVFLYLQHLYVSEYMSQASMHIESRIQSPESTPVLESSK